MRNLIIQLKSLGQICLFGFLLSMFSGRASAQEFAQKLDVQVRADDRSSSDVRYQYRLRYYPQLSFNENWSAHAFAVTGDDYGSSHNTIDDGSADYMYVRRVFARHQGDYGKTEIGIIPTYKGRVSSSGLSKDGWIKGVRHVRALGNDKLEVVVGQLSSLDPSNALNMPNDMNYFELEYSSKINEKWSFEVSAERMTQANFARTEVRYAYHDKLTLFGELVSRVNNNKVKTVIGLDGEVTLYNYALAYFAHYSFVSDDFGLRAELTEDFLGTGNGFSGEVSGKISSIRAGWFVRYDAVQSETRVLAGLKWSL